MFEEVGESSIEGRGEKYEAPSKELGVFVKRVFDVDGFECPTLRGVTT